MERNRIKRRMREAVRLSRSTCQWSGGIVFNPRKSVLALSVYRTGKEVTRGGCEWSRQTVPGLAEDEVKQVPAIRAPRV